MRSLAFFRWKSLITSTASERGLGKHLAKWWGAILIEVPVCVPLMKENNPFMSATETLSILRRRSISVGTRGCVTMYRRHSPPPLSLSSLLPKKGNVKMRTLLDFPLRWCYSDVSMKFHQSKRKNLGLHISPREDFDFISSSTSYIFFFYVDFAYYFISLNIRRVSMLSGYR